MPAFAVVCRVIGLSQLILGALYLLAPSAFLRWQGLTVPPADTAYPLAMLAARFLVYGAGMFRMATQPVRHLYWARGMVLIQLIDLAAGVVMVSTGTVSIASARIPMANAALFALALHISLQRALRSGRDAAPCLA